MENDQSCSVSTSIPSLAATDGYYCLVGCESVAGQEVAADAEAVRAPRAVRFSDVEDRTGLVCITVQDVTTSVVLAQVEPRGPVAPAVHEPGRLPPGALPWVCEAGWVIRAVLPVERAFGPCAAQVLVVATTDLGEETEEAYIVASSAQLAGGSRALDAAADAAVEAMEAMELDGLWWRDCTSCIRGWEALALAARDLIGTTPTWTPEAYARLTEAWRQSVGPVHPDDQLPAREPVGTR